MHTIRANDGTVYMQEEPPLSWTVSMTVLLDGVMMPVGLGFAVLLAQRTASLRQVEVLEARLGDLHQALQKRGIDPSLLLEEE